MQWLELTSAALPAAQLESGLFGCCLALLGGRQLLVSNARVDLYAAVARTVCCTASVPPALPSGSLAREGRTGLQMVAWEHGSPRPACTAGFLSIFCLRRFVFPVASRPGTFVRGPQHASRLPAFAPLFVVAGLRWMLSWEISA